MSRKIVRQQREAFIRAVTAAWNEFGDDATKILEVGAKYAGKDAIVQFSESPDGNIHIILDVDVHSMSMFRRDEAIIKVFRPVNQAIDRMYQQEISTMNAAAARKLAVEIIEHADADGQPVADTTIVGLTNGLYWVADNGEKVDNLTKEQAIEIIVENLTAE